MTISSRTPEGKPNQCSLCGASVVLEPSVFFGDAPCPNCGNLLWFLNIQSESQDFVVEQSPDLGKQIISILAKRLGISPDQLIEEMPLTLDRFGDSLEVVELVMELEEILGTN